MFDSNARRRAVLTVVGGALLSVVLALDDVARDLVGFAVVVPVLIGFGVLEIYGRYDDRYGATGRAGVVLAGVGLAFLLVTALLYAASPPGLIVVVLVGVPGITGVVALALGSVLLARSLRRLGVVSLPVAVLLGAGVPLAPLVAALLAAAAERAGFSGSAAGVLAGLSGAPYGAGWMLVGYRLLATAGEGRADVDRPANADGTPHLVAAAVVGGVFVLLGAGAFLPLGPLSGTPWNGQSPVLDAGHLLVGAAGLALAAAGDAKRARAFDRTAGLLALSLVALTLLGTFLDVRGLRWLAAARLVLNGPDLYLYLPAGVVLTAIGFGIGTDPGPVAE